MRPSERAASRTAVLVCQGRAAADRRLAPGRFSDPIAVDLLRADERTVVEQVRAATPPAGWSERAAYEAVRACADVVAARTVAIDDALHDRPHPQLVILGAGLDTRAWRLPQLADVDVTEVDHPASQGDKRVRLGDRPPIARTLRFAAVDLAVDELDEALDASGHDAEVSTTWLWEGVVPYLTREEVVRTLRAVGRRSARGSSLIVNYQTPSLRARFGRRLTEIAAVLGLQETATANEPWRTLLTPAQMASLLVDAGFGIHADEDLLAVSRRLGLDSTARISLQNGRVAVALRH
ncbi:class I SAM-dependent methyltransferase [Nocardioides sp. CER19]|uniref:class I SAM-dependent methyltransferase n=1 Tax=Nocardioides sp. CER19 TaxID=3038538 RepID=UPI00244710E5|nr:class I SAM-dependent methyltransferase [Nocardioides sp. CER19]MDH2416470.1 class I SAM-dependent methyltransferase [Nocardioides sp. CER19]